jgi:hypothetical protein
VLLTSRVLLLLGMVGVMLLTHVGLLLLTMLLAKVWLLLGGNDDSTRIYGIRVSVWCSRSAIQINFFALEISQSASASRSCMWACILVCLIACGGGGIQTEVADSMLALGGVCGWELPV